MEELFRRLVLLAYSTADCDVEGRGALFILLSDALAHSDKLCLRFCFRPILQNHYKFIAADPEAPPVFAKDVFDASCRSDNYGIAFLMSILVVDLLQIIDIKQDICAFGSWFVLLLFFYERSPVL